MPVLLPAGSRPAQFADALSSSVARTAKKVAGSDGVIDVDEAEHALGALRGRDLLVSDALVAIVRTKRPVSVEEFVQGQRARALQKATDACGADGKLSKRDVSTMPSDLRLAFHVLRTGKLPDLFHDGLAAQVPPSWRKALAPVADKINEVDARVEADRATHDVFPARAATFAALQRTSLDDVKVVVIGQDPYPSPGDAMGLSFSVPPGVAPPPSLQNIFAELQRDKGIPPSPSGDLTPWADRGVLLLNTVLTVRAHAPASHAGFGWEEVTDQILRQVNAKDERVVFLLLGAAAQKLGERIDTKKHTIVARSHPSPLSVKRGFEGTKPFSAIDAALVEAGRGAIDWRLG